MGNVSKSEWSNLGMAFSEKQKFKTNVFCKPPLSTPY